MLSAYLVVTLLSGWRINNLDPGFIFLSHKQFVNTFYR